MSNLPALINDTFIETQQEVSSTKAEGLAVVTKLVNKDAKVTNIMNLPHSNQVFMNHISVRQVFATCQFAKELHQVFLEA